MGRIALVVDSTASLTEEMAAPFGIRTVPLTIHFGEQRYVDGEDLTAESFYQLLRSSNEMPATSQPSPLAFRDAFAAALDEPGTEGVLCITISKLLSGTFQSAEQGRSLLLEERPDAAITVVDSATTAGAQGLAALSVAKQLELKEAGGQALTLAQAADLARAECEAMRIYAVLDTLEFLVRGGRIGRAKGMLGEALGIKPMISIRGGEVVAAGRTRTRRRALESLVRIFLEEANPAHPVGLVHTGADEDAERFEARLRESLPSEAAERLTCMHFEATPVLGSHGGPGLFAVAFRAK